MLDTNSATIDKHSIPFLYAEAKNLIRKNINQTKFPDGMEEFMTPDITIMSEPEVIEHFVVFNIGCVVFLKSSINGNEDSRPFVFTMAFNKEEDKWEIERYILDQINFSVDRPSEVVFD